MPDPGGFPTSPLSIIGPQLEAIELAAPLPGPDTAELVDRYFESFTGPLFDTIALDSPRGRFDAGDFQALAALAVEVPSTAVGRLLEDREANELLREIPTDIRIDDRRAAAELSSDSPAATLYDHLRDLDGVGYVTRSKLLALKRPALIPIRDSFLERQLGIPADGQWWAAMGNEWQAPELRKQVDELRSRCKRVPAWVTDLRLLDVAIWMHEHERQSRFKL